MKIYKSFRIFIVSLCISLLSLGPSFALEVKTLAGHVKNETDDGFISTTGFKLSGESLEDALGNLYIVDKNENKILVIDQEGYKKTFAGSGLKGSIDGKRLEASFDKPHGIVQDSEGNFYVSDTGNNLIRKISTEGIVSTFAGSDDSFKTPMGLAIDANNNIYVADQRNHLIKKISSEGAVTTIAGTESKSGLVDGLEARFNYPEAVALDSYGNIFVADKANDVIRKIDSTGLVSTYANGFNDPSDLAIDSNNNIYVADRGTNSIKKVGTNGLVTTLVGGEQGFWNASTSSYSSSFFDNPYCISINQNDELLISDLGNNKVRKINLNNETPNYQVDTLIGSGDASYNDGEYHNATIRSPGGIAYDRDGNLYFTDSKNDLIRKLDTEGNLTTIAGITANTRKKEDKEEKESKKLVKLNHPHSIVINSSGEIYFTDRDSHSIKKIDTEGNLVTVSGSGKQGYQDGTAEEAEFNYPSGLAIDESDNIYIADTNNHKIRKLSKDGTVTTISGTRKGYSSGNINFARFDSPTYLTIDGSGNIYVADEGNHKIRKISNEGFVTSIAGIGQGYQDGLGREAQFNEPKGLAVSTDGKKLYVSDSKNNRIREIDLTNSVVKTLVGSGLAGYKDGNDDLVSFKGPTALILDKEGNLIVSDADNHRIRKVSTKIDAKSNLSKGSKEYYVSTISGNHSYDLVDGSARFSSYRYPHGIVKDSLGNLFVTDKSNHVIRKINSDGQVSVFSGTGIAGKTDGVSTQAQFSSPTGIAIDSSDNLYVVDSGNNVIRKITNDGYVSTVAGSGEEGFKDGTALEAEFKQPFDLSIAPDGTIYVSDSGNHRIRKIDADGSVTTYAGTGSAGFIDGYGKYSKFNSPHGIELDEEGNLYLADFGNNRIRKIDSNGLVTTVAGSGAPSFQDGDAKFAQFNGPIAITLDKESIIVSDHYNNKIRKISPDGNVTTLAGLGASGAIDGIARNSSFNSPVGITMDKDSLLICDSKNNVVRKLYKSETFAKEVLGFAYVSSDTPSEDDSGVSETNTKPVIKMATNVAFHSKNKEIATFVLGTDLEFEVFSFDSEDKDTINNSVTWESSYQGFLGTGNSYNIKNLKLGSHHITATVKDSGNLSSSTELELRIVPSTDSKSETGGKSASNSESGSSETKNTIVLKITTDENKLFKANQFSRFNAAAFDLSGPDAVSISSQIEWSSSIDGELGSGAEVNSKLSKGTHVITAKIDEYSDSITIEVADKKNSQSNKILAKPKALDDVKIPDLELESPHPKQHDPKKGDKAGSGDNNSVGIKEVKIKLL